TGGAGNPGSLSHPPGDPGVEDRIDDVQQEVDADEAESDEKHARLQYRKIPTEDRLDGEPTYPRPGKDGLGDDGPAQERPQLKSDHRHDGNECVTESVKDDYSPGG